MEQPQVISLLIFIALSLIGIVYWIHRNEIAILKDKTDVHEKRIQKLEDIQGTKLDRLTSDFEKFQIEMKNALNKISEEIHKKNNTDNALDKTLNALLKHLQQNEKDI